MDVNHEPYIKEVEKWAELSVTRGENPFACVIVEKDTNQIVGTAHDMVHICTDPTQHAEIVAIGHACHRLKTIDLSNCVLYASGKPCLMCFTAIQYANILEVYYSKVQ